MIQDSNGCTDDYDYFSRPEILQELRFNVADLIHQDRYSLQELIDSLHAQITTPLSSACSPFCECCPRWSQTAAAVSRQLQERSLTLSSIGDLATRLIDFIAVEAGRHAGEVQDFQGQVDRLQNAIEEVTSRNSHIENDVMVFREQLEAARQELEEIAEQREEQAVGVAEDWQAVRDLKIQTLERELEKMKSQLTYFKVSAVSKSSLGCQHALPSKNTPQTSSLRTLEKHTCKLWLEGRPSEEEAVMKYTSQNRQLEEENQRLKMEIDVMKKSAVQFVTHEQSVGQSAISIQESLVSKPSRALLRVRTSSKTIQAHPSSPSTHCPFDFQQFFSLFKSKREERLGKLAHEELGSGADERVVAKEASRSELQLEAVDQHTLNSQWSSSSLTFHNAQPLQSQLILLTQQSEDRPANEGEEYGYFFKNATTIIENKETEPSLKESTSPDPTRNTFRSSKSFESIGINTHQLHPRDRRQLAQQQARREDELFGSRIMKKIAYSPLVSGLTNFVVNNRVKRRSRVANSGTATILK